MLANADLSGDGSAPNNFLMPEIRKLAKIWCTLTYIVGICWGNCIKLSNLMCPYKVIQCLHLIWGCFSPKILGPKNVVLTKPFCNFIANISTLEQDIVDWLANCDPSRTCLPN